MKDQNDLTTYTPLMARGTGTYERILNIIDQIIEHSENEIGNLSNAITDSEYWNHMREVVSKEATINICINRAKSNIGNPNMSAYINDITKAIDDLKSYQQTLKQRYTPIESNIEES